MCDLFCQSSKWKNSFGCGVSFFLASVFSAIFWRVETLCFPFLSYSFLKEVKEDGSLKLYYP